MSNAQLASRKLFNFLKTIYSRILLRKGRLEMGLKLFRTEESKLLFFRRGLTRAVLSSDGKIPVSREQFIMARMSLDTESKMVLKNLVGRGSRGHVDGFSCDTTLLSISISASAKKLILLQHGGRGSENKTFGIS